MRVGEGRQVRAGTPIPYLNRHEMFLSRPFFLVLYYVDSLIHQACGGDVDRGMLEQLVATVNEQH